MASSNLRRLVRPGPWLSIAMVLAVTACNSIAPPLSITGTGSVEGLVFFDASEDGVFDPSDGDFAVVGALVSVQRRGSDANLGGATSGADGRFSIADLPVGTHDMLIDTVSVGDSVSICQNPLQVSVFANETRFSNVAGRPGCLITIIEAKELAIGEFVIVRGVVTSSPGQIEARRTYIQDATAGTLIFSAALAGQTTETIEIGDQIEIGGVTATFANDFEIVSPVLRTLVKNVGALTPVDVTTQEIAASGADFADSLQGRLIRVVNAQLADVFGCGTCGSSRNAPIVDASAAQTIMRIDAGLVSSSGNIMTTALPGGGQLTVGNCYDITGFGANFNQQGQIFPRSLDDIVEVTCN